MHISTRYWLPQARAGVPVLVPGANLTDTDRGGMGTDGRGGRRGRSWERQCSPRPDVLRVLASTALPGAIIRLVIAILFAAGAQRTQRRSTTRLR